MVVAWLEEKGYRLEQILKLTRGYVRRVLDWPRDKNGGLRQPPVVQSEDAAPTSQEDRIRAWHFERGWPAHKVEPLIREWRERVAQEQQEEQQQEGEEF